MFLPVIIGIASFLIGGTIAFIAGRKSLQTKSSNILKDAETEAEMIKKDKILQAKSAPELCSVAAAVGLAQNFAALRALTQEGINKGHMRLHSKTLALMSGATPEEAARIYDYFKDKESEISLSSVKKILDDLRSKKK